MIEYVNDKKLVCIEDLVRFVRKLDIDFTICLGDRVDIDKWVKKIYDLAQIVVALDGNSIVGLLVFYDNDVILHKGYMVYLAVSSEYRKIGIAFELVKQCLDKCISSGMNIVGVHTNSIKAKKLYQKIGFVVKDQRNILEYETINYYLEKKL